MDFDAQRSSPRKPPIRFNYIIQNLKLVLLTEMLTSLQSNVPCFPRAVNSGPRITHRDLQGANHHLTRPSCSRRKILSKPRMLAKYR